MDSNKRPETMARITTKELANAFIEEQITAVRKQVGDKKVLLALSGGVDSSVLQEIKYRLGKIIFHAGRNYILHCDVCNRWLCAHV